MLRRFISAVLLVWAVPASAALTYVYEFEVFGIECNAPDNSKVDCAQGERTLRGRLDTFGIWLNDDAARSGHAELTMKFGPNLTDFFSFGFVKALGPFLPFEVANADEYSSLLSLRYELSVGIFLGGSLEIHTFQDDFFMGGDAEHGWRGRFASDEVIASWHDHPMTFSGEWRLVQVIPEPPAVLLISLFFVSLLAFTCRMRFLRN